MKMLIIEAIFNALSVVGMHLHLQDSLIISFYRSRSTVRIDSEAIEPKGRGFKQWWFGITRLACEQVNNKSEKICIESNFIIKYTSAQTVASPEDWVARGAGLSWRMIAQWPRCRDEVMQSMIQTEAWHVIYPGYLWTIDTVQMSWI